MCTATPIQFGNIDPAVTADLQGRYTGGSKGGGQKVFADAPVRKVEAPPAPAAPAPPAPAPAPVAPAMPAPVAAPVAQVQMPAPAPTTPTQGAAYTVTTSQATPVGQETEAVDMGRERRRTNSLKVAPAAVATSAGTGLNIGV